MIKCGMLRRIAPVGLLLALVSSGGVALAAFPPVSPVKTGEIAVAGNPQKVAVDLTDDTAYVVSTGPGRITAANGALTASTSAATGGQPSGVAVDSDDDTIYVTDNDTPGRLLAFTPSLTLARAQQTLPLPRAVAVHPVDDTVYVTYFDNRLGIINGRNLDDSVTVVVGSNPYDVAVNPVDDTIYTANYNGQSISRIAPGGLSVSTVSVSGVGTGVSPLAVAVHPTDDTVYFGGQGQRGLVVAAPNLSSFTLIPLNGAFAEVRGISVSPDGSTIYLATDSFSSRSVALKATNLDDSYDFAIGNNPNGVSATNSVAYFALNGSGSVAAAAPPPTVTGVAPSSGPTSGGTAITVSGTGFVAGQTTATIGGSALLNVTVVNATTLTATTPAGAAGAATIVVTVGLASGTLAGGFTFVPPPPVPASAPLDVTAAAGNASARVTWTAPTSSGSFPISHYQAISSPGGRTCLVAAPTLTCEVPGLTNGTAYTFTVKALNGAGWSAASEPSNAVVPAAQPRSSILITGSRDGKRIEVTGSTTGFGMGAILNPWVRLAGQTAFAQGRAQVLVSMDGTFAWGRRTGKKASVYMQTPDGSVRSNTVTIPAR